MDNRARREELTARAKALRSSLPGPLPDWHDRKSMAAWLNTRLDELLMAQKCEEVAETLRREDEEPERFKADMEKISAWYKADGPFVALAKQGSLEGLLRVYPQLAPFLRLPRQQRGQRFSSNPDALRLAAAIKDVANIRDLWRNHYGKVKRRRGDLSAEEIAAERWMVDVGSVRAGVSHRKRLRASSSPMPGAGGWPYED